MTDVLQLGVLASGSGTDLQSIIDACEEQKIQAHIACVISDKEDAHALTRAKDHHIPAYPLPKKQSTREEHESTIIAILEKHDVELVIGAGYMKILTSHFVDRWYGRLINIHPALLPSFKGTNGQGDAIDYGVKIAGCTTHYISNDTDCGPIILQAALCVKTDDTKKTLAARILEAEHQILPRTIDLYQQDRLILDGRRVTIRPQDDSWTQRYPVLPDVLYSEGY